MLSPVGEFLRRKIMKRCKIVILLAFWCCAFFSNAAENLKFIEQWKHPGEIFDKLATGKVDKDGHVVGLFFKTPISLISKEKVTHIIPFGEGPSDLAGCYTFFRYGDGLAFVERNFKIKIFTKKNGTYVWKETLWLKKGPVGHSPKNGVFFDNKIFLTGFTEPIQSKIKNEATLVRVYDTKGDLLKDLVKTKSITGSRLYMMIYHIVPYKNDRLLFLPSNELKVSVISAKSLEVVKEASLQIPSFYKKMPGNFYFRESYANPRYNFARDLEEWAAGYSRVTTCGVDKSYLVVQIRTCSEKMKKFALLFYNADTFKLENTIYTDDFLLDIKDGKYYFFENGEPGLDEDACEDLNINICKLEQQK
jgi:hypothetical protein